MQYYRYLKSMGVLLAGAILLSGCSGTQVNKEALVAMKKVGLCTVTLDKLGQPSSNNLAVTQEAADYALKRYDQVLKGVTSFTYVPRARYQSVNGLRTMTDFKNNTVIKTMMKNNKGQAAAAALMMKLMGKGQGGSSEEVIADSFQKDYDQVAENELAANTCPDVPYRLFKDSQEGVVQHKVSYGNASQSSENKIKKVMLDSVAQACKDAGLDGMMVIWNKALAFKTVKGVNVVNMRMMRTNGSIRLNPTLLLVDKNGQVVVDLGWPVLDDLSPTKMSIPMFIVVPKDKRTHHRHLKLRDVVTTNEIDLKDPKGEATKALHALIDETSTRLVVNLRKTIGEIE